jgi:hypothetical protein
LTLGSIPSQYFFPLSIWIKESEESIHLEGEIVRQASKQNNEFVIPVTSLRFKTQQREMTLGEVGHHGSALIRNNSALHRNPLDDYNRIGENQLIEMEIELNAEHVGRLWLLLQRV